VLAALKVRYGVSSSALSDDLTRRNMDLFAAKVMPYLRS
jgi:hypothetical protein